MIELTEAHIVGLLAEAEFASEQLRDKLIEGERRGDHVRGELSTLLSRLNEAQAAAASATHQATEATRIISEGNGQLSSLHRELAALRRRADNLKTMMNQVEDSEAKAQLRRERARLLVQIEDRDKEVRQIQLRLETARTAHAAALSLVVLENDKILPLLSERDKLQTLLPAPQLYLQLYEALAARAHCRLQLSGDFDSWATQLREAGVLIVRLHQQLRAGSYRIDRNSEVLGGRATATVDACYAAAAIGDFTGARDLFDLASDPDLVFDHIFNVFRCWCLGLFLHGRHAELQELLAPHRFSQGLRGGYCLCFSGLLAGDAAQIVDGLAMLMRAERQMWQDPRRQRGAGVVSLGAAGVASLAFRADIPGIVAPGPTLPDVILQAQNVACRRLKAAKRELSR
jgi:hypothetical protein